MCNQTSSTGPSLIIATIFPSKFKYQNYLQTVRSAIYKCYFMQTDRSAIWSAINWASLKTMICNLLRNCDSIKIAIRNYCGPVKRPVRSDSVKNCMQLIAKAAGLCVIGKIILNTLVKINIYDIYSPIN